MIPEDAKKTLQALGYDLYVSDEHPLDFTPHAPPEGGLEWVGKTTCSEEEAWMACWTHYQTQWKRPHRPEWAGL